MVGIQHGTQAGDAANETIPEFEFPPSNKQH